MNILKMLIKIRNTVPLPLFVILLVFSARAQKHITNNRTESQDDVPVNIYIDPGSRYQTIANFGASDAWSCQFVGLWPEDKKEAIANLLFSKGLDQKGSPKGIGLSLWRFNLGAGSAQQGAASGIRDEWRRAESFLEPDGTYNWDRLKGQVWFAKKAREKEVENLLVFLNSPPVNFTRNNKAYSDSGRHSNLSPDSIENFTTYIARSVEGLQTMGLRVDMLSPVNEPQWDWADGGQEGSPFWNDEIAAISRSLDQAFDKYHLTTKIDIAEAAQLNYLYKEDNRPGRGSQIDQFFNRESPNYIGNLSHISKTISGHSYFTTSPTSELIKQRKQLNGNLKKYRDLNFWMSEYCILGDNNGEINGNKKDLGIQPALYMAKVIHHDLVVAEASAWHWWTAISAYDYKDGLIYIDKNKKDGSFEESKMLWALGNYSRFIRPGFQRIEVSSDQDSASKLLVSGYASPDNKTVYVVLVNTGGEREIVFQPESIHLQPTSCYITSATKNLEKTDLPSESKKIRIPAASIVSILLKP